MSTETTNFSRKELKSYFTKQRISTPTLTAGKSFKVVFEAVEGVPAIQTLHSSCGCSTPVFAGGKLTVSFTPASVPLHLKEKGFYVTTKSITVDYVNGFREVLSFTSKIT
jgi:acyl dehydratase